MSNKTRTKDKDGVEVSKNDSIVSKKDTVNDEIKQNIASTPNSVKTNNETNFKPKRIIILDAIKAGGATRDKLMELAEVDTKNLASQFSYLRLMGQYPVKKSDGVYRIATREEVERIKLDKPVAIIMDPKKRYTQLTKKLTTLQNKINKNTDQPPGSIAHINLKIDALSIKVTELRIADLLTKHPLLKVGKVMPDIKA